MADTKHTPGPWDAMLGERYRVADSSGQTIATATHTHLLGRRPDEEVVANTLLQAAAPDLLTAAIEAREVLLGGYTTREGKELLAQDVEDALALLNKAIARATLADAERRERKRDGDR